MAFRVAALYDHNGLTEVKSIGNGKSNFQETIIGRASLNWAPTDKFSLDLMLQYTDQEGDFYRQSYGVPPCAGSIPAPFDTVTSVGCGLTLEVEDKIALNTGPNPNHYYGALITLTARYSMTDHLDLIYVGGYNDNQYYNNLNFDFAGIGEASFLTFLDNTADETTTSNELRLQSVGNEVYNFTYGLFLSKLDRETAFRFPGIVPGTQLNDTGTEDFGAFTNQRFSITDKDDIQLGLRYSKTTIDPLNQPTRDYDSTTGNASYQHQFTDDLMAYVSYGTAYRPGSANSQNPPVPADSAQFRQFRGGEIKFLRNWLQVAVARQARDIQRGALRPEI